MAYPSSSIDGPMLMGFVIALYTLAALGHLWAAGVISARDVPGHRDLGGHRGLHAHDLASETFMLGGWVIVVPAIGAVVAGSALSRGDRCGPSRRRRSCGVWPRRLRIARELGMTRSGIILSLIMCSTRRRSEAQARSEVPDRGDAAGDRGDEPDVAAGNAGDGRGAARARGDSPTRPGPSLEQLPALVEASRASGLDVELRVDGRADLPGGGRGATGWCRSR